MRIFTTFAEGCAFSLFFEMFSKSMLSRIEFFYSIGAKILTTERTKDTNMLVFSISGVTSMLFSIVSTISSCIPRRAAHLYIQTPFSK